MKMRGIKKRIKTTSPTSLADLPNLYPISEQQIVEIGNAMGIPLRYRNIKRPEDREPEMVTELPKTTNFNSATTKP